jgi:DNA-binding XRE family transcriptional regulator
MINSKKRSINVKESEDTDNSSLFSTFLNLFSKYQIPLEEIFKIFRFSFGWLHTPGTILKKLRTEMGYSQRHLAEELETCQSTISRLESNNPGNRFLIFRDAYSLLLKEKFRNHTPEE